MRRLNIKEITGRYEIRYLKEDDIPAILSVCKGNPQFYLYTGAQCTKEQIKEDMKALPNGKEADDKYYFGFFQDGRLHAVMDLIDGYPDDATAFIGFFMLESACAGKGEGTRIVAELLEYLKQNGLSPIVW